MASHFASGELSGGVSSAAAGDASSLAAERLPRALRWLLPRLGGRRGPLLLAALTIVLFALSLGQQLTLDDHIQRGIVLHSPGIEALIPPGSGMFTFATGDLAHNRNAIARGFFPWWSAPYIRLEFWRPLTELTHRLDYALWPNTPWAMHAHNLLWLALLVGTVALSYRRIHGAGAVAALAGLAYAIDDTHNWGAAWLADRNGVVAALFGALTLLCHDRWRRDGSRGAAVLAVVLVVPGLFAGEAFVAACGYLLAYALTLDRGSPKSRVLSLLPVTLLVVGWYVTYTVLGYGSQGSGIYRDPAGDPWLFARGLAPRMMLLLGSHFALGGSEFSELVGPEFAVPAIVLHTAVFGAMTWLFWPRLRADRQVRFWYTGMVLSAVPFCAVIPMERNLLIPGIGGMGALSAVLIHHWQTRRERPGELALVRLSVAVHLVLAPLLAPIKALALPELTSFVELCGESVLHLEDVAHRHLVMLDAPDACASYASVLPIVRGWPVPLTARTLASGLSDTRVTRVDADTLRIVPETGWLYYGIEGMFANDRYRRSVGEQVHLPDLTIRITEVTPRGRPLAIEAHFDRGLESGRYILLGAERGWLVPVRPFAIGETRLLPGKMVPIGRSGEYPGR